MTDSHRLPTWRFLLHYRPSDMECPPNLNGFEHHPMIVGDFGLFAELAAMAGDSISPANQGRYCYSSFRAPEGSPVLARALERLEHVGWKPVLRGRRANEQRPSEFRVTRLFPDPTADELDAAPFLTKDLCLEGGWGLRLEGDVLHANWEDDIGHPKAPVVDVVGDVRDYPTAWTLEAQRALADAGMVGADFAPIVWSYDDPLVKSHTHYLRAKHAFPRSKTPRCVGPLLVDEAYLTAHGEPEEWEWDDGGRLYGQARMFYTKNDLDRMAGIDIARTMETFPTVNGIRSSLPAKTIYSQRFRRWADAMGYGMEWLPVVVMDD